MALQEFTSVSLEGAFCPTSETWNHGMYPPPQDPSDLTLPRKRRDRIRETPAARLRLKRRLFVAVVLPSPPYPPPPAPLPQSVAAEKLFRTTSPRGPGAAVPAYPTASYSI